MHINNPWCKIFSHLESSLTCDYRDPCLPRMTQIHSNRVVILHDPHQIIGQADGMVTTLPDVTLQVRVADCGNIYAYDPIGGVIGICHAGRKGTHTGIIQNFIQTFMSLGSQPQDLRIWTGPCISVQNYEFGPEVYDLFDHKYIQLIDDRPHLDLPELHRDQLIHTGILAEHIIQSEICTFFTPELPSYRRDGPDSGRITGMITMNS